MFIVENVRLIREALTELLRDTPEITVIGGGPVSPPTLSEVRRLRPDVVLVNASAVASVAAVRAVVAAAPDAKVLALGVSETASEVVPYAEAGIDGYVVREGSAAELVASVHRVIKGEMPVSALISGALLRRVAALAETRRARDSFSGLTRREAEIADLIGQGLSNKQIATRLSIEVPTVKNHVHSILRKLHVDNRSGIVRLTLEHGLRSGGQPEH